MSSFPREIDDAEAIARGICSPFHLKNGKLTDNAYWPPYETDEVSVMRIDWIGPDACKQRAKALENSGKTYKGLAILSAKQIRESGAGIVDTREIFEGHADIKHRIVPIRGEPLPAEQLQVLRDRVKMLAKLANYYPDTDPRDLNWVGPSLRYKG
jgi:hypothetical protein